MDKKQWSENSGFFSTGTQVFLVMAECGNLSEASSVLDMHPSTISYHLSELEKSLNLPLFDHSKRPLKLTSEGLNLYNELKYHFSSLNVRVQKLRQKNFLNVFIVMPLPCQFAFDQIQFLTVDFWFSGSTSFFAVPYIKVRALITSLQS